MTDGGGELASAGAGLANKCPSQLYATDPAPAGGTVGNITLSVPCVAAPAVINVTVVAAPGGFGPFYFATAAIRVQRGATRAARCPPPTPGPPPPPPYPFVLPLDAGCPASGAAAQHGSPCPSVPCVAPRGKNGTCLIIDSWPVRSLPDAGTRGGIMAEARVEELTDAITPASHHYVTGSAPPKRAWTRDMTGWELRVDGQVAGPRSFTMAELQALAPHVTRSYVLECASNWGRGMLPAYQQADWWAIGGVGCAQWTGVLLRDVLHAVGVNSSAVYVAGTPFNVGRKA